MKRMLTVILLIAVLLAVSGCGLSDLICLLFGVCI
jgi:hypothetical protein